MIFLGGGETAHTGVGVLQEVIRCLHASSGSDSKVVDTRAHCVQFVAVGLLD